MRRMAVVLGAFGVALAACGGASADPLASAEEVLAAEAELESVAAVDISASTARDADALRALYVDGIVIRDGDEVTTGGVGELASIAEFIWAQYPDSGEYHSATYVGSHDGIVVIDQWGFEGFTTDSPLYEYRIIEVADGVITAWEAVYDLDTRPYFGRGGMDEEAAVLLEAYLAAWNSGDANAISVLYDPAAVRSDLLFGDVGGGEAIERQVEAVLERFPGLHLEMRETLGLRAHQRVGTGGVVSITSDSDAACAVEAVVYIESPGDLITRERVYYEADSLIACGWAG